MPEVNPNITSKLSGITTNNPLIIRGGRQVPNPNYTGPNPYKMDAAGKLKPLKQLGGGSTKLSNPLKNIRRGRTIGRAGSLLGIGLGAKAIADGNITEGLVGMALSAPKAMGLMMLEGAFRPLADGTLEGVLNDPRLTEEQRKATLKGMKQGSGNEATPEELASLKFPNETSLPPVPLSPSESGGTDTRTGTKYNSFQEQQQDLMGNIAKRYSDPRTAALIRGVPTNPFASTQLPYTEDNLYTNFSTENQFPDFGIDPSKMLDRSKEIDYAETVNNLPGYTGQITFNDSFTGNYVSPVNYDQPQTVKDPMLLKGVSGMTAMRMKDRDLGLMYASGQFFAEGADGKPVLVNRDLAKSVRRGDEGAKDQLAAYLAGGGIKPQGGVIANPTMEQMSPPTQSKAESLVDPSFDRGDYEAMGGNPVNFSPLSRGGGVQMDIDSDFDLENPNTSQIGPLQHPFSKVLAENPVNQAAKPQVVDTDKYGSVTYLINKYGIDDYLDRMTAGQFF